MAQKERQYSWAACRVEPVSHPDADGNCLFEATLICRELRGLHFIASFWGNPKGLPGRLSQAEAFIRASVSQPRSLESMSRILMSTRDQKPRELSEALGDGKPL